LLNALPVFLEIETLIAGLMNLAPPSAALAGVWAANDATSGVWSAPANIALRAVDGPLCPVTDSQLAGFNTPLNGQAINIVRNLAGQGCVVWGARTLDGNSQDDRYLQVRRTLIYVQQSIKLALRAYAFAPNDRNTWVTVTAAISDFLNGLWQAGGLMGAKPSDAYSVACGVGSTMTGQDVLDGYMNVQVTLQLIHPAEFIALSFTQAMNGGG
jgi:phage tail sheath protein FI